MHSKKGEPKRKIRVLSQSSQFVFEFVNRLGFEAKDDDQLLDELNEIEGVAYANRDYGQYWWLISLDADTPHAREAAISKISEVFWRHGVQLDKLAAA